MLTVTRRADAGAGAVAMIADRRLYLTADRSTVVEEGDPRAAWLLAGQGSEIPPSEVSRLGLHLVDGRVVQSAPDVAAQAGGAGAASKMLSAPANKMRRRGEDK